MKKLHFLKSLAWWVALVAALAFSLWYILPFFKNEKSNPSQKRIITIWNVDTFEGGKGSRTTFLNSVAKELAGDNYFLVTSKTMDGVRYALERGEMPDMLSYGVGLELVLEDKPKCWCIGKYALFSRSKGVATAKNTVISRGGENEPLIAAALHGFIGDVAEENSLQAYMDFLNGKFDFLLGTQRDVYRFLSRNVSVDAVPINEFSDLRQYIVVMRKENYDLCKEYIELLLSNKTQTRLTEIGMLSPTQEIYSSEGGLCASIEQGEVENFLSVSASLATRNELKLMAKRALRGENVAENLKKILKTS